MSVHIEDTQHAKTVPSELYKFHYLSICKDNMKFGNTVEWRSAMIFIIQFCCVVTRLLDNVRCADNTKVFSIFSELHTSP